MRISLINARETKILIELSNIVYPLSSSALVRKYPLAPRLIQATTPVFSTTSAFTLKKRNS